ncbi:MAG TPA: glycoside hydrolase family 3 C-terminal domain-containing protein, partial [Phenylobacterium sp.]|nr:glycoside hydrolase family 3 C-terminal domain-containing protein [Phenylobacterium sp.]
LAREAVRKSLVLLKNDGVLPIKASARILVAGSGADDIGRQSGGWTLSWQGTENKNSDFPNAQSIYGGISAAAKAAGGSASLSVDGRFDTKPDVAIVVFGETPYAEGVGDVKTLEYQLDGKADLALLKRLKAAGVPVVAVFLSGRPLWVNPEINASDAFVAAWLPGSEGGGVADVLLGDAAGRPRHDFTGKLSFSWPKTAGQFALNRGQPGYDPLFPLGYGLTYKDQGRLAPLSEDPGLKLAANDTRTYLAGGKVRPPWRLIEAGATVRPVDAGGVQEAGRQLVFAGGGEAAAAFTGPPTDFAFEANADMSLLVRYRLDEPPSGRVRLAFGGAGLDVTPPLVAAPRGEWRELKIRLACFRDAGASIAAVAEPFRLSTAGRLTISLESVKLTTDPAGAICPNKP